MNNSINIENTLDQNKSSRGISIKIEQIKGLKKNVKDLNPNNKYFIRFFMNMCNRRNNKFYGNTYRGEKIGYAIPISLEQHFSSGSFLDVDRLIYEEFFERGSYIPDEVSNFC